MGISIDLDPFICQISRRLLTIIPRFHSGTGFFHTLSLIRLIEDTDRCYNHPYEKPASALRGCDNSHLDLLRFSFRPIT